MTALLVALGVLLVLVVLAGAVMVKLLLAMVTEEEDPRARPERCDCA